MAAITKSEVISLALTRNLSDDHILDSDISVAVEMYVNAYLDNITYLSSIYDAYVKPVIAFGVIVNIFHRISYEITDRGMVAMVSQGTSTVDRDGKLDLQAEIRTHLYKLIKIMIEADGKTVTQEFQPVGFSGNLKQEKL